MTPSRLSEYLSADLALVPIPHGSKGPRTEGWQLRDNAIRTLEQLHLLAGANVGLAHAWCEPPTCAIDIDDYAAACRWLEERGVYLDALMSAADAVQIRSGRDNRGKLIYRLPHGEVPLRTHKIRLPDSDHELEFRCASSSGTTVQDVLPPSIHPETGKPYCWGGAGSFETIPEIPPKLLAIWKSLLQNARDKAGKSTAGKTCKNERIGVGSRNDTLTSVAGRLRKAGLTTEELAPALHEINNRRCDPPLEPNEVKGIASSVGRYEAGRLGVDPAEEPSKRHFVALDVHEFLAKKYQPRETLLSPWLPRQGLAMLYAKRGVGKTFFALEIAYAVACGADSNFCGWTAARAAGVLYIDGEMPAGVLQERLAAITKAAAFEPQAPLRIMPSDEQSMGAIDLANPCHWPELEPLLDDIELIIVDNISTLCRAPGENEAQSWIDVQEWALQMRRGGRAVLFVHHAGKGGAQRGTSKREDVLDTVIQLKHPSDYEPSEGARFEVHFEKARGIYGDDVKPMLAQLHYDESGRRQWTTLDLEQSTYDKVLDLHREGLKQNQIAGELDVHISTVSRHLKRARQNGEIAA